MAQERLGMRDVLEILRLKFLLKRSDTETATSVRRARSTVADCMQRAMVAGIATWEQVAALSVAELEVRLYPVTRDVDGCALRLRALPDWSEVYAELKRHKRVNLTLSLLWEEYKQNNPEGYQYSQFAEYYRRWKNKLSLSMRQEHRAGERTFVDYCDGLYITDPKTGEKTPTELFVGVLGASSYTYAEASYSQDIPNWLLSHARMFEYFEGVSEITTPDNLRSAIKKSDRYEPEINPSYQDMITHYGTCVIPARVRKPKDKAKAEAGVLIAQRWILAKLRNRAFYSLAELNAAIRECLEILNNKPMRALKRSRRELWIELDRPALKPLPAKRYEFAEWKRGKLGINYHVSFDDHFYSAPYQLVGQELWCRASAETVEIFYEWGRVASHLRSYLKEKYVTLSEHMPPNHRAVAEWTPERIARWAETMGPKARTVVETIMRSKDHPQQGFNAALGVIRLGDAKAHGPERLEKACAKALFLGSPTYTTIKNMLKNRMESVELPCSGGDTQPAATSEAQLSLAVAQNVRGKGYYH
jgi:transposase